MTDSLVAFGISFAPFSSMCAYCVPSMCLHLRASASLLFQLGRACQILQVGYSDCVVHVDFTSWLFQLSCVQILQVGYSNCVVHVV